MNLSGSSLEECGLDKKRTVILLRSVVAVSLSYLVLFARDDTTVSSIAYVAAVIFSNVALALLPDDIFRRPLFSKVLFLGDTAVVLIGLYYTVGFSQDFLIVYFFTMFLTAAVETVGQIAVGAVIVSGLYGCWLWTTSAGSLGSAQWLRLPFFFIVAVFYAYMTEEVRRERDRRLQAERESHHLRFLLNLADAFSPGRSRYELVEQVCSIVASAFPRLTCTAAAAPYGPHASGKRWFPIRARGTEFGALQVIPNDGGTLDPDEEQFCLVVALIAGNTLHALQQAEAAGSSARLKEEFLGTLSHELRTPLHAILGYIEMLEGVLPPWADELARESLARLRGNTSRLQALLEEMLWFAELRAGQRTVQPERLDLRTVFERFAARMGGELAERPIRFESRVDPDVPVLETDARKLNQILSGLLSNAAKFTQRGSIELTARCAPGEKIEITVRDSGIGIDPKDFPLIFEDFRQLDASLTRRVGGLGLGLALAQELAVILGGQIMVDSKRNRGTTFCLRLPVRYADKAEESAAQGSGLPAAVTVPGCPALALL
jgi:signal transduction histidine kinase